MKKQIPREARLLLEKADQRATFGSGFKVKRTLTEGQQKAFNEHRAARQSRRE